MELREGYKKTDVGFIPLNWTLQSLSAISSFITKGSTPTTYGFKWEQNGVLFLRSECVSENGLDLSQSMFISEEANKVLSRSEIKSNDILITITGNVGRVIYLEKSFGYGNINQHIAKIRIIKDDVNPYFVFHYLNQPIYRKYFNSIVTGQAYPQISLTQVRESLVPFPPTLEEQTAIANALSDIDNLIKGLEKIIAKKRNIKQGAMQKLLKPKVGWEVKKLGELLGKVTTGKLDANAMKENGEYRFYTCAKDYSFIDDFAFDTEALLVSGNGANVGYIHYYKGKFNAYQRTYVLTDFKIDIFYIKLYLDSYLKDRITTEVSAGNTPYIKMDTITDMVINFPSNSEEQKNISIILFDMEEEIQSLETKLEKYKKVKLGMMQNLLTGKIRLV
jgi:type I restriction enzyme S subunit